uniref:Uncharacterized protein n=1 Tax=Oryza brachyantha TaxID=4533 RepID=J3MWF3_ORYBR
ELATVSHFLMQQYTNNHLACCVVVKGQCHRQHITYVIKTLIGSHDDPSFSCCNMDQ